MVSTFLRGASLKTWLLLAVCLLAGAGLNLYRTAWRLAGEVRSFRGFYPQTEVIDGQTVRWSRAYAKAEVPLYRWRALRWHIQLTAPPEAGASGASAWILVNETRVRRVTVGAGWHDIELVTDVPPAADLALQFQSTLYGPEGHGIGIGRVSVEPVFTLWNAFQTCAAGALIGLLLWCACVIDIAPEANVSFPLAPVSFSLTPGPRLSWTRALTVLGILWLYLGAWALLKPVLQAPDEPQHQVRASSVRLQPWAAPTPDWLTVDTRFLNPLAAAPPDNIGKLFFQSANHLSLQDIAVAKAYRWEPDFVVTTVRTPLATYPTTYYWTVFGLAEATTALAHLTPYQNIYAYRAWTVMLAGVLWLLVYRALQITPGVAHHADALFAFLLLNTMLVFVSSSVTPDAVNVPLATIAVLLTYRLLITGRGMWLAASALLACGLTKPTFLLLLASLPLPIALAWRSGTIGLRNVLRTDLAVARAGLIAYCVFYAWSPPRFVGAVPPKDLTLSSYADFYIDRLPLVWRSYWGQLGWLDYGLNDLWYILLLILIIAIAILVRRRAPEQARFARFAAWLGVSYFVLMTIGEYWYLPSMGYNFHGRHLLPACLAFAGLVLHENRYARWSLFGLLAVMNILLVHATIVRYFDDGLTGLWASLPLW